ncbi:MAG: hypothetical protein IJB98_00715 [Clostridia bacterium]|nr:hypothetical protein [Clostridia bacterium]
MQNQQRAGLIALLSIISNKTGFTKYTIPKLANTSFYQVKNDAEGVDFYITDFKNQELKKELKDVFHAVWKEYMGEYITDESLLDNESFVVDKIGKIIYKYSRTHSAEDFIKDIEVYNHKTNIINGEFSMLQIAESIGKSAIDDAEHLKQKYYMERLVDVMTEVVNDEAENLLNENRWALRKEDRVIRNGAKTKAKLITYAVLNGYVGSVYCANKLLGNTLSVGLFDKEGKEPQMVHFHTKKHKEFVNMEFAKMFYDMYLKNIKVEGVDKLSLEEKENIFVNHFAQRFNAEGACNYILGFVDNIYQDINFGEDQLVSTAVALNVASYLEDEDGGYKKCSKGYFGKNKKQLNELFEKNFEQAEQNPKEAWKRIAAAYRVSTATKREVDDITQMVKGMMEKLFGLDGEQPENE